MQQVIVKEVRGPLGKGDKKFYAVVDDKGAEFTTFDTKIAAVTSGSVLEVELKVEGKYVNITEWKVIKEGSAPTVGGASPYNGSRRTFAEDVALEEIKRKSIEAQKRAELITNLFVAGKIDEADPLVKKLKEWLGSLEAVEHPVQALPTPKADVANASKAPTGESGASQHFENVGAMFAKANLEGIGRTVIVKHFGIKETEVAKIVPDDLWPLIFEQLIVPARKLEEEMKGKK